MVEMADVFAEGAHGLTNRFEGRKIRKILCDKLSSLVCSHA